MMTDGYSVNVDVVTEIVIQRPADVVAAYAADPTNTPDWYATSTRSTGRRHPRCGSARQVEFVARFLGRSLAYTYEFVELVPGAIVMRTRRVRSRWRPPTCGPRIREATRMTLRNRGEPAGFST